ncbi:Bd3614 family nucleic acid deaminase [Corallococcus sp. M7]
MKMALQLKQERNRDVALLIPSSVALKAASNNKASATTTTTTPTPSTSSKSKPTCPSFCFGLDVSNDYAGHTAVVNVVQHACERYGADARADALIYLTRPPSNADRGIFAQQITGPKPRLIYLQDNALHIERPSKANLRNLKGKQTLEKPYKDTDWSESNEETLEKVLSGNDEEWIVFDAPWPVTHVAPWISPLKGGATYDRLGLRSQQLFDHLFLLVAYSLAAPTDDQVETHLGRDDEEPSKGLKVGALLVSPSGELLSWGADFSSMLHAEVSTLKLYSQQNPGSTLPPNARLYTSLEPCFQCAGLISTCAHPRGLTVVCGQEDLGLRTVQAGKQEVKGDLTFLKEGSPFKPEHVQEVFPKDSPYLKLDGKVEKGTFASKLGEKQIEAQSLYEKSMRLHHKDHQSKLAKTKKKQAELQQRQLLEKQPLEEKDQSLRTRIQELKSKQSGDSEEGSQDSDTTALLLELEGELNQLLGPLKELGERHSSEEKTLSTKTREREKKVAETNFDKLAPANKNKYAKSIMEALGLEFYSRRLVKARLQLVLMARLILVDKKLEESERRLLMRLWDNAMFLLLWAGRATHQQLISNALRSLKRSRGGNAFKAKVLGEKYTEKKRPDLEEVRLELNDILTEAKRFLEKQ